LTPTSNVAVRDMRPALQITVYPAGGDQFRAMVGGRIIAVSDEPLRDVARALLAENVDPATPIVCRRMGQADERSTVGVVAGPPKARRDKPPASQSPRGSGSRGQADRLGRHPRELGVDGR
jgi:hypothetical protein